MQEVHSVKLRLRQEVTGKGFQGLTAPPRHRGARGSPSAGGRPATHSHGVLLQPRVQTAGALQLVLHTHTQGMAHCSAEGQRGHRGPVEPNPPQQPHRNPCTFTGSVSGVLSSFCSVEMGIFKEIPSPLISCIFSGVRKYAGGDVRLIEESGCTALS